MVSRSWTIAFEGSIAIYDIIIDYPVLPVIGYVLHARQRLVKVSPPYPVFVYEEQEREWRAIFVDVKSNGFAMKG